MNKADSFYDFLIIGQGLAGSLLAWRLLKEGKRVLIVDPALKNTASRTAAGLINPATGKRLVKAKQVDDYLLSAKKTYQEISDYFSVQFFCEKNQVKLFRSEADIALWQKRQDDASYQRFLGERFNSSDKAYLTETSLGGFQQKQCGYLDSVLLLDTLGDYFASKNCLLQTQLKPEELNLLTEGVEWRGIKAGRVIFCDGHLLQSNPWFSWLPMQAVQGEILTMQTTQAVADEIIQFGKWLLPLTPTTFKLGATWQWQPLDGVAGKTALEELTSACYSEFPHLAGARLLERKVGIRPATKDKNPFIGSHFEKPQLMVFNGFGSKGSLLIPWYSERFVSHLLQGEPLPSEGDIKRYESVTTLS